MKRILRWPCLMLLSLVCVPLCFCQTESTVKGMAEYKAENYEEAIELLSDARKEALDSSLAAFFLGMAYKKTIEYGLAARHLRDAVRLEPKIKEALIELIDVMLLLPDGEGRHEIWHWINTAETEGIYPGRTAFLKGRALMMEKQYAEAVASFESAKKSNPKLAQAADFQIGMCRIELKELEAARDVLEKVMNQDPESDLSVFARNYHDMLSDRLFADRPFRFALTALGQYDTNMILKPTDDAAAEGITDEKGFAATNSLRAEFVPYLEGPFNFYAQYMGVINLHEHHGDTHDLIGNSLAARPGYSVGKFDIGLSAHYGHYLRRNPDYEGYLGQLTVGPSIKTFFMKNHFLEAFAGYRRKDFFEDQDLAEENRDSNGADAWASWIWLIRDWWLFNLKYEFVYEDTDGANWENMGNRFAANTVFSLTESLRLQAGAESFIQNYSNSHTLFGKEREDHTNVGTLGLTWDINRRFSLLLQYARTRCNSNIGIYDYTRDLVSGGFELRL